VTTRIPIFGLVVIQDRGSGSDPGLVPGRSGSFLSHMDRVGLRRVMSYMSGFRVQRVPTLYIGTMMRG
jgi:hypothetical protein